MREPVADGFYPFSSDNLDKQLDEILSKVKVKKDSCIVGAIVPHAGYAYSGAVAAHVYKMLAKYDVVVVLGTNHTGVGERVAVSLDSWKTPLGVVECDVSVAEDIIDRCEIAHPDELAHMYEHSIEVQLPFLQKVIGSFKLVAVSVSSDLNGRNFELLGEAIREAVSGKKAIVIASSDFTHFGDMYGFKPASKDEVKWVEKTDKKIIDAILGFRAADALELASKTTVCGYAPIAVLLAAVSGSKAKLVKYATSYDVSKDKGAIVGYAGIVFIG
ncbi:MAG: AmmeMemoRadiSam system protein B [archaeon]